jgi:mediator of RNA polymerase II transcription subunit 5
MSLPKWTSFVQRCLLQRVDAQEFQDMAGCMIEKHHVTGPALLDILMRCRGPFCPAEDPLIPLYTHALVTSGLAKVSDVLFALIQNWNKSDSRRREEQKPGILSRVDAVIVLDLATIFASDEHKEDQDTTRTSLIISSRWLSAMMKWLSAISTQTTIHPVVTLIEAIGSLIAALASGENGITLLANKNTTGELHCFRYTLTADAESQSPGTPSSEY